MGGGILVWFLGIVRREGGGMLIDGGGKFLGYRGSRGIWTFISTRWHGDLRWGGLFTYRSRSRDRDLTWVFGKTFW